MRNKSRFIKQKSDLQASFFNKVVSVIKVIRIELLVAIIALIISLGQYFQHSINARINITGTWREGYTSEIRSRVSRFRYFYNQEKKACKDDTCRKKLRCSLSRIVETKELLRGAETSQNTPNENTAGKTTAVAAAEKKDQAVEEKSKCAGVDGITDDITKDEFIYKLIHNELEALERAENKEKAPDEYLNLILQKWLHSCGDNQGCQNDVKESAAQKPERTREEYVEIVSKYRNAIIECLNTLEAVKAVIESKPLPFRVTIFYKDTLEGRYRDIIEELKIDLMDFIEAYRESTPNRKTEAWFVLTSDESYLNDLVNVVLYIFIFAALLTLTYLIKTRMQEIGLLQETKK